MSKICFPNSRRLMGQRAARLCCTISFITIILAALSHSQSAALASTLRCFLLRHNRMAAPTQQASTQAMCQEFHWTEKRAKEYEKKKIDFMEQKCMPLGAKPLYDLAMTGLKNLQDTITANVSEPEVKEKLNGMIAELHGSMKKAAKQRAQDALKEIGERVIAVSKTIPSKKGIIGNGAQSIGFFSAQRFLDLKATGQVTPTREEIRKVSDWTSTEYCELLMRAWGLEEDGSYKFHPVSPGSGMRFLSDMDDELQFYNNVANMFDLGQSSEPAKLVPNIKKKYCRMSTGMGRLVVETARIIEINETPDENDEFECFLVFCVSKKVRFIADDAEKPDHPLYDFIQHPIVGPAIIFGKMSFEAISKAQYAMFLDYDATDVIPEVPAEFLASCSLMGRCFKKIVVEGSDTMMLRPKAAPIIEPRSLPIHYELKATLAERMVYHWGDQAQLGGQSFRAMEPDEKIIDPSLLPHGWTEERQKWGEAALPLACVAEVLNKPRGEACMVLKKKYAETEQEGGYVADGFP